MRRLSSSIGTPGSMKGDMSGSFRGRQDSDILIVGAYQALQADNRLLVTAMDAISAEKSKQDVLAELRALAEALSTQNAKAKILGAVVLVESGEGDAIEYVQECQADVISEMSQMKRDGSLRRSISSLRAGGESEPSSQKSTGPTTDNDSAFDAVVEESISSGDDDAAASPLARAESAILKRSSSLRAQFGGSKPGSLCDFLLFADPKNRQGLRDLNERKTFYRLQGGKDSQELNALIEEATRPIGAPELF